ncbi:DUF1073 domain-containing protein [Leptolyngbya sp. FACHB-541]|uniref:anti-CBASS protein Acb1 family protein n=1 Tax=Leptolyngbya sp. FACHB-541 TaxID=2692810 RepID=UPI00168295BB|nr:anti-CBASS Acb1 family protein [Leptolyngbya sp. FACHB-541]MBD1995315.1 DUF1073 domain-containing protein [Leptolyngbya sp. FACHB-541]
MGAAENISDKELRFDGVLENAITGMGDPEYDKSANTTVGRVKRLGKYHLENLYQGSWICRNICNKYPDEATREWLTIKMGGKTSDRKRITEFQKYEQRLGVRQKFRVAGRWARLYGGAAIVIISEDGQPIDQPLRTASLKRIRKLVVLDRHKIRPYLAGFDDPLEPEQYELILPNHSARRFQDLAQQDKKEGIGLRIHHSRVIRFDGVEMPPDILERNEGWGLSSLDPVFETYCRYEQISSAITNLAEEASLFVYGIKGLSEMLKRCDEQSLRQLEHRLRVIRKTKSNLKMLVKDAEDEQCEPVNRSMAGLPELLDKFQVPLVGASEMPVTVIFGRGPVGLAAQGTGDSEERVWAKMVNAYQEADYTPKLRSPEETGLFDLIWLAQDGPTRGKMPEDWGLEYKPLVEETEEEKLTKREKQSNIDRTYKDMNVLLVDEIRSSRFAGSEYSIETELDEKLWNKKQAEEEASLEAFDDYGNFGDEPQLPDAEGGNGAAAPSDVPTNDINSQNGNGKVLAIAGAGRKDSSDKAKYVLKWQGLRIGVTHESGEFRNGYPMFAGYGNLFGSYGDAEDGMSVDVYVGRDLSSPRVYKIRQLKRDYTLDESKLVIGVGTSQEAVALYLRHIPREMFGGVEEVKLAELQGKYRKDCDDTCACTMKNEDEGEEPPERRSPRRFKGKLKKNPFNSLRAHSPSRPLEYVEEELDREDSSFSNWKSRGDEEHTHLDAKHGPRHKPGYHWVDDEDVKNKGYWRKNPRVGDVKVPRDKSTPVDGAAFRDKWFPGNAFKGNFYFTKQRREAMVKEASQIVGKPIYDVQQGQLEDPTASILLKTLIDIKDRIPPHVQHIAMGHGQGKPGVDWSFSNGVSSKPIQEWVDENIPEGETCMVDACEDGLVRTHHQTRQAPESIPVLTSRGIPKVETVDLQGDRSRQDAKHGPRHKPGYHWVDDEDVKNKGYWRKNPPVGDVKVPRGWDKSTPVDGAAFRDKWFPGNAFKGNFYFTKQRRAAMVKEASQIVGKPIHNVEKGQLEDPLLSILLKTLVDTKDRIPTHVQHIAMGHGQGEPGADWEFSNGVSGKPVQEWVDENIPVDERCMIVACEKGQVRSHHQIKANPDAFHVLTSRGIPKVETVDLQGDRSRQDAQTQTRAGHHWVDDKRVKEGGYWRKNPGRAGRKVGSSASGGDFGKAIAAGAAIAGVAAVGAGAVAYAKSQAGEQSGKPSKKVIAAVGAGIAAAGIAGGAAIAQVGKEQPKPEPSRVVETPKQFKKPTVVDVTMAEKAVFESEKAHYEKEVKRLQAEMSQLEPTDPKYQELEFAMEFSQGVAKYSQQGIDYSEERIAKYSSAERSPQSKPHDTSLSFIIEARKIKDFKEGEEIDVESLKYLINESAWRSVAPIEKANSIEKTLEFGENSPDDDSVDYYIKVDLSDGQDLTEAKIGWSLKRKLQPDQMAVVKKVSKLKRLTGLEHFREDNEGSPRLDAQTQTKPGHHWVDDKRVKEGGYWRKNPGGAGRKVGNSASTNKAWAAGAAGAAIAAIGAGAVIAHSKSQAESNNGKVIATVGAGVAAASVIGGGMAIAQSQAKGEEATTEQFKGSAYAFPSNQEIESNLKPLNHSDATPSGYDLFTAQVGDRKYFVKKQPAELSYREAASYNVAQAYGLESYVLPAKVMKVGGVDHVASPFLEGSPVGLGSAENIKRIAALRVNLEQVEAQQNQLKAQYKSGELSSGDFRVKRIETSQLQENLQLQIKQAKVDSNSYAKEVIQSIEPKVLKKLVMYDYLNNIADRHTMNLYRTTDGELKLIDNALTFHDAGADSGFVTFSQELPGGIKKTNMHMVPPSTKMPSSNSFIRYGNIDTLKFDDQELDFFIAQQKQAEAGIRAALSSNPKAFRTALTGFRKRMKVVKQMRESQNRSVKQLVQS